MRIAAWISYYGRLLFILLWMGLLFLIATNIQAGWLYVVISFLGLLAVYSAIIPVLALRPVRAVLELPELCERGAPAAGTLFLENLSRRARYLIHVELPYGDCGLEFDPPNLLAVKAPGDRRLALSARFTPLARGRIAIEYIYLNCAAPAGILNVKKRIAVNAHTLVHPRISPAEGEALAGAAGDSGAGKRDKFHALEDPYLYKLREYNPGDSLCRLHWKLTAKRDRPIVRVHERKIFGHSGIVVDNLRGHYAPGEEEKFEKLLEQAASLAHHLLFARGGSVSVSGTAAPEISMDTPDAWPLGLKWFASIRLEQMPGESRLEEVAAAREVDFSFAP